MAISHPNKGTSGKKLGHGFLRKCFSFQGLILGPLPLNHMGVGSSPTRPPPLVVLYAVHVLIL